MSHNGHRTGSVPESGGRSGLDISHKRDFLKVPAKNYLIRRVNGCTKPGNARTAFGKERQNNRSHTGNTAGILRLLRLGGVIAVGDAAQLSECWFHDLLITVRRKFLKNPSSFPHPSESPQC
jgi:hypothetical protein